MGFIAVIYAGIVVAALTCAVGVAVSAVVVIEFCAAVRRVKN